MLISPKNSVRTNVMSLILDATPIDEDFDELGVTGLTLSDVRLMIELIKANDTKNAAALSAIDIPDLMNELAEAGAIFDSGQRREGDGGEPEIVWYAVPRH